MTATKKHKRLNQIEENILCLLCLLCFFVADSFAQSPSVSKVDPPSWWAGHTINPVRLLVRGANLRGAQVKSLNPGCAHQKSPLTSAVLICLWMFRSIHR